MVTFFFIIYFAISNSYADQIVIKTPFNTLKNEIIFITGNSEHCQWKTRCLIPKRIGPNTFLFKDDEYKIGTEFKITRGTWDTEAADSLARALPNFKRNFENKTQVLNLVNWKDKGPLKLTGKKHSFRLISRKLSRSFEFYLWIPTNYSPKNSKKLLIAFDGNNLMDPSLTYGGIDWALDEIITEFPMAKQFPILGLIPQKRESEYNFFKEGKLYAEFIVGEVLPFIRRRLNFGYHQNDIALLGSSYGAIAAFTFQRLFPETFGKAFCLSFPPQADNFMPFDLLKAIKPKKKASFTYLDNGDFGSDASYPRHAKLFKVNLNEDSHKPLKMVYRQIKWANHMEADWSRRVGAILEKYFITN